MFYFASSQLIKTSPQQKEELAQLIKSLNCPVHLSLALGLPEDVTLAFDTTGTSKFVDLLPSEVDFISRGLPDVKAAEDLIKVQQVFNGQIPVVLG